MVNTMEKAALPSTNVRRRVTCVAHPGPSLEDKNTFITLMRGWIAVWGEDLRNHGKMNRKGHLSRVQVELQENRRTG